VRGERTAVVLDRHPLWLDAFEQLLERVGIRVVGKTTSAEEALALVEEHRPDVLITGAESVRGDADDIACVREAREIHPTLKSVVVSAQNDAQCVEAAFAAGASAYCVKTAQPEDLASAIRQSFEHSVYFASGQPGSLAPRPTIAPEDDVPELTRRELEILQLVAEGHSNSQLATMLWVTEQTVKFHLSNIYRKLDVANRTEASRWAQLHGLLPADGPKVASTAA
jgi:DNA-binding NarL/FixJ family response regulator